MFVPWLTQIIAHSSKTLARTNPNYADIIWMQCTGRNSLSHLTRACCCSMRGNKGMQTADEWIRRPYCIVRRVHCFAGQFIFQRTVADWPEASGKYTTNSSHPVSLGAFIDHVFVFAKVQSNEMKKVGMCVTEPWACSSTRTHSRILLFCILKWNRTCRSISTAQRFEEQILPWPKWHRPMWECKA